MGDYYPLIDRQVAALRPNTPESRRTFYDRARAVQLAQLRSRSFSEKDVERERLLLEEAIFLVETITRASEHAKSDTGIVSDFAKFCEEAKSRRDRFYDASELPHPKQTIVEALERQIVLEPFDIRAEWLESGTTFLWNFLEGIGSNPVSFIEPQWSQFLRNASLQTIKEYADRVLADDCPPERLMAIAGREAEHVKRRIDAAVSIRKRRIAADADFERERLRLMAESGLAPE